MRLNFFAWSVCNTCINDFLDIPVHDLVQLVQGQVDTVVGHTTLREIVGTDLLGTVPGTDLASSGFCLCIVSLLASPYRKALHAEAANAFVLILDLGLFRLAVNNNTGRDNGSDVPRSPSY